MSQTLKPENDVQLLEAIQWAVAEKTPLEILAGGSKRGLGRPMKTAAKRINPARVTVALQTDLRLRFHLHLRGRPRPHSLPPRRQKLLRTPTTSAACGR